MYRRSFLFLVLASTIPCRLTSAESQWTQFRGSDGSGVASAIDLPTQWSEDQNVLWKTPIVGVGWSSPVYADNTAWITSATKIAASEAERKTAAADSPIADAIELASSISLWLTKIDLSSGQVLEQLKIADVADPQKIHSLNSYASPTPVIGGEFIYCHFGDYGTFCVNRTTNEIVWRQRVELDHSVGPGSSPVLYENLLILTCDGLEAQYITALDIANGEVVWRTDRPEISASHAEFRKAFSTPLVISAAEGDQVVIPGAQWFVAYEPKTGDEIWRINHGRGFSNVPRPVFDGSLVYLCTGFMKGKLLAVDPNGRGDVTESHVRWRVSKQVPTMPSPVVSGQRIYTVNDAGVAQAIDVKDGQRLWKQRVGGKFSASPLLADRKIYLCSHEGETTVIAAEDSFREIASNQLEGQILASPVVVDSDLLIRTDKHLYRIGE